MYFPWLNGANRDIYVCVSFKSKLSFEMHRFKWKSSAANISDSIEEPNLKKNEKKNY